MSENTRVVVRLTPESRNRKTGPIPVSTTTAATCPDACPLKQAGCYAYGQPLLGVWQQVTEGRVGMTWRAFCDAIAALPIDQLWRHNQAGDLPGANNRIDARALGELVTANKGKRGFTFTHKPMTAANRRAVAAANAGGFTINLSANNLTEADTLADLAIAPVVVVLPLEHGKRHDVATPAGRRVVTCPATYLPNVSCQSCQLCQRANRPVIVGFPAHGNQKKAAAAIARGAP